MVVEVDNEIGLLLRFGRHNLCKLRVIIQCIHCRSLWRDLLSTSATLCCRICCRVFGFSNSLVILLIIDSANSRCCLCLTCPSYRIHESNTDLASEAKEVLCSSSKALASRLAVSCLSLVYVSISKRFRQG